MITLVKPRIRRCKRGYSCSGLGKVGHGKTPRGAYMDWMNEVGFYPYEEQS